MAITRLNSALRSVTDSAPIAANESLLEQEALSDVWRQAYRQIRVLGAHIDQGDSLHCFFPEVRNEPEETVTALGKTIFEDLKEGGEIIFLPFDRESETAARNIRCQWQRFTDCPMDVLSPNEEFFHLHDDVLLICLSACAPVPEYIEGKLSRLNHPLFWIGPALPADIAAIFRASRGYFAASAETGMELYAAVCMLFAKVWRSYSFQKGTIMANHFRYMGNYIRMLLNDGKLRKHIRRIMLANRKYHTAFYIGPPAGTGQAWVRRFERIRRPDMEWHTYGACAHGPLATVDNNVKAKYTRLSERKKMIAEYGEKRVAHWEGHYLGGLTTDDFLSGTPVPEDRTQPKPRPFFAEGDWYIPSLRPDYNTAEDNLIILDATREHYFEHALDELSVLGSRNARIILITQNAFVRLSDKRAMFAQPFSHLIQIPSPEADGEAVPISGFMVPLLMDIIGIAMAEDADSLSA
jgi:hypothetical protein